MLHKFFGRFAVLVAFLALAACSQSPTAPPVSPSFEAASSDMASTEFRLAMISSTGLYAQAVAHPNFQHPGLGVWCCMPPWPWIRVTKGQKVTGALNLPHMFITRQPQVEAKFAGRTPRVYAWYYQRPRPCSGTGNCNPMPGPLLYHGFLDEILFVEGYGSVLAYLALIWEDSCEEAGIEVITATVVINGRRIKPPGLSKVCLE